MLKLSENAVSMLISKYRTVLKRMSVKNAAALAVCCVMFGAAPAAVAADITYTGNGAELLITVPPLGGATALSLFPGTAALPGASGNTVTVNYMAGTNPWRVFGGLSNSAAVTGNTVNFLSGAVDNNLYGGYDAAAANGLGAVRNIATISGGTVAGSALAGISLTGNVTGNSLTLSGGSVGTNLYGGSASGSGVAIGNSVKVNGGQVGDGLGTVTNGWVVGGFSNGGGVDSNSVTVTGGTVNTIEGGESGSGVASNNTVTITGGTVKGVTVRGGFSNSGLVTGNSVAISEGSIAMDVMGGQSNSGNAANNRVTFTGGRIGQGIAGGFTNDGEAAGNKVLMSGGEVAGSVVGGFSSTGKAENNEVMFSGGRAGSIAGGKAMNAGNISGNKVNISGGEILYDVYGGTGNTGDAAGNNVLLTGGLVHGRIYGGFSSGSATGNSVTIGRDVRIAGTSSIFGGGGAISSGNTLNINGFRGSLQQVNSFQNYNFILPGSLHSGGVVLSIIGATPTNLSGASVAITGMEGGAVLAPGATVTLISSTANAPASFQGTNVLSGVSLIYDLSMAAAGSSLVATVNSVQVNPQTKALSEGRAASMAFLNQGSDLVAGAGLVDALAKAKEAKGDMADFGAVSYGSVRHNTGSHADVDGASLLTGFASRHDTKNGSLVKGVFLEAGWGNYDTYNSFSSMTSVRGGGDASYYGLGALIRRDAPSGSYVEGSLRGGKSRTTFSSGDLQSYAGQTASYTSNSPYYGAHIGVGQLEIKADKTVDYYAKYFWTHQNGSDVTAAGDPISFSAADSSRLRGGIRLSKEKPGGTIVNYVGLAYEYEFDGKAKGSVYGLGMEAPSLRGGTGIIELGMSFKSRPESNNTLCFSLQGYTGKREGLTGNVQFKTEF